MKTLNLNPNFKRILELYGIDISKCTVNENGKICGESVYSDGYWSYSPSLEIAFQACAGFIAEDEKVCIDRQYKIIDDKLQMIKEEII